MSFICSESSRGHPKLIHMTDKYGMHQILLEIQGSRAGDVRIRAQILLLQECELKKMPPEAEPREAFFSIHTTGAGGFASQILTSYALDR